MARPKSGNADLLRLALSCQWPAMRRAATQAIAKALKESATKALAAEALGINKRTLERIRAEHPSEFEGL